MLRHSLLIASFVSCCAIQAQSPAQPDTPVIRAESRTVLVDAVAFDKKGHFATDLTAKDFRIWEDGKEQAITGFSLESSGISAERPGKHYFVLFFDASVGSQAVQMEQRRQATRFVEGFASLDRYLAVVDYSGKGGLRTSQNFTTDRDLIIKALSSPAASSNSTPGMNGNARIQGFLDMLDALQRVMNSLAPIRGRKALMFFSGGMPSSTNIAFGLEASIAAANRANVAIYSVGPGTTTTATSDDAGQRSTAMGQAASNAALREGQSIMAMGQAATLRGAGGDSTELAATLAGGTGGLEVRMTTDLATALGRIAQEQDEYYLLSYTPVPESAEGSCHNLQVKVDRAGLDVRARRSYCTVRSAGILPEKSATSDIEARAASGAAPRIAATMQLPWFYLSPGVARVHLAMDIAVSNLKFRRENGKFRSELLLTGLASRPDGSVAARVTDAARFSFDTQLQVDDFLGKPYHYEYRFRIAPGDYSFRMAFGPGAGDGPGFGKAELPLHIARWDGQTLTASSLALSRDAHRVADLTTALDESLLEESNSLVARGTEVVPAGGTRFHAGEIVVVYMEAYEPLLAAKLLAAKSEALPARGLRIRILDASTGAQRADSGVQRIAGFMRPGNIVVPMVAALPVQGLPPGAYRAEISVVQQDGAPVVRTAEFEIIP